jgi:carboxyl-terminal processing protease
MPIFTKRKNIILSNMKKSPSFFHPIFLIMLFGAISVSGFSAQKEKTSREFEISKSLDVFNALYKELDLFYVDTIQSEKVVKNGIDAMLGNLDPYTNYIPESEMDDLAFMTTGEYAGIGAIIGQKDGKTVITEIYEGMPAYKSGLKAGDIFLEIDNIKVDQKNNSEVSEMLKGQAKTIVKVTVKRLGEKKPVTREIIREKIVIDPISYSGVLDENVGYIHLSSFTDKSAETFKEAFLNLKNKRKIKSLIIDLRSNPGGILSEAVKITNFFVDKKSTVVYTKGKVKQWDEVYKATKDPIDLEIPIVVLVNRNSASAAEIVAGAMQDLDRAVVAGERTFGKGLVQTTRELPYGGSLKVTIAKYYIPSGRCIQAIDYTRRSEEGFVQRIPDSLTTEFKTSKGRIVRDGGGIYPDLFIEPEKNATISYYLYTKNLIFDYVDRYQSTRPTIPPLTNFTFTEYDEFREFVKSKDFTYKLRTEELLNNLIEIAKEEGYYEHSQDKFTALKEDLSHDIEKDLELFKDEITELISIEIAKRYYYQKGEIIEMLKRDKTSKEAVMLLKDKGMYETLLKTSPQPPPKEGERSKLEENFGN